MQDETSLFVVSMYQLWLGNRLILAKKPEKKGENPETKDEKKEKKLPRNLQSLSLNEGKRWQSKSTRIISLFAETLQTRIYSLPSTLLYIWKLIWLLEFVQASNSIMDAGI
jgi:hypothetical protein